MSKQFEGFKLPNTTPMPDICWICSERRLHWKKRPDGLCGRCSGDLLSKITRQKQRAKNRGYEATLTLAQWTAKLHNSQGCCHYCHTHIGYRALTLEHVIPVTKGGGTTAENCVPACMTCNWNSWVAIREAAK